MLLERSSVPELHETDQLLLRTFAATCEKNGISAYQATARMAQDPAWDIFTDGVSVHVPS